VAQETQKKEALYELAEVGERFGPIQVTVDDHKVKSFAFTQDDHGAWYLDASGASSPFGGRIGHATILANDLLQLYHLRYAESGASQTAGLHAQEQLWFHAPVRVGETATLQGEYVDKYERRGKGYVVMDAEARGEDGRLLVRHRGVEIMRIAAGNVVGRGTAAGGQTRRVTGEVRPGVAPVGSASAGLPPRTPVEPLVKRANPDQMAVYSMISPFSKNIHTDLEAAEATGLRLPIMQGQQQLCFMVELLTGFFGASWFTSGHIDVRFVQPLYAWETITVRAAVLGEVPEAEGSRLEVEVWVENTSGAMTALGWGSALVSR
jgi:acyl dehydratase